MYEFVISDTEHRKNIHGSGSILDNLRGDTFDFISVRRANRLSISMAGADICGRHLFKVSSQQGSLSIS